MILNIAFLIFSAFGLHADESIPYNFFREKEFLQEFKEVLIDIREQRVSPAEAKEHFAAIMKEIRTVYPNIQSPENVSDIVFPLIGSSIASVGGKGKGFYARQFDLFDVSINKSHPAHDIFIYDPDQDCRDNRTKNYVDVASVSNGIVIAIEKDWTNQSKYRGGNYVWVYDFERGGLWYYAHFKEVGVDLGQILKPGDKIGLVGRTGFNAQNPRSDTHLHLMHLALDESFYPKAINYYDWLKTAEVLKTATTPASNEWKNRFFNADKPQADSLKIQN